MREVFNKLIEELKNFFDGLFEALDKESASADTFKSKIDLLEAENAELKKKIAAASKNGSVDLSPLFDAISNLEKKLPKAGSGLSPEELAALKDIQDTIHKHTNILAEIMKDVGFFKEKLERLPF